MKRLVTLLLALILTPAALAQPFPQQLDTDSETLSKCNQTEVTAMLVVDVAEAALFSADCSILPKLADELQLSFIYQRGFAAEDFIEAADTLLRRNLSDSEYQQIQADLEQFNQSYQSVVEGDRYDIRLTAKGLSLLKNGEVISQHPSQTLGRHYFAIWFGDKPFNNKMKQALLSNAG
ncbi:chalcone isomerase family protein [uncultured Methylophaga sp.]|jgi:hypothetical protein|uniref:chalcone isomerase family protein n=1 Tax=uncultured Methylophaga sp. TaxID=285271 RepID=UPI00260EB1E7|nr:chalcone isomerase family protein [uncultured Methylophaga sp.]